MAIVIGTRVRLSKVVIETSLNTVPQPAAIIKKMKQTINCELKVTTIETISRM